MTTTLMKCRWIGVGEKEYNRRMRAGARKRGGFDRIGLIVKIGIGVLVWSLLGNFLSCLLPIALVAFIGITIVSSSGVKR